MNSKKSVMSTCLQQARNWSGPLEPNHKFDSSVYNQGPSFDNPKVTDIDLKTIYTKNNLGIRSPKLLTLAKNIYKIDMHDHKTHGQTYKHFIFSNSSNEYGAKLIASALQTMLSLQPIMQLKKQNGSTQVRVGEGGSNHYGLLTPAKIYHHSDYEDDFKDKLLKKFNHPDNMYGKHMRFIILDSTFKEGVNLENVKYVHLFEPLPTMAQEKQAVARAIRFCSHEHTAFEENEGWKVQVHVYKLFTPLDQVVQIYDVATNTYKDETNVDIDRLLHKLDSSADDLYVSDMVDLLESVAPIMSVDFHLTKELIPKANVPDNTELQQQIDDIYDRGIPENNLATFVAKTYEKNTIQPPEKVNNCLFKETHLTTFQKYLAEFFSSQESMLGMLLWHSPGSGKTCSAINIAKTLVEKGYTNEKVCWATTKSLGESGIKCKVKGAEIIVPTQSNRLLGPVDTKWLGQIYNYKQLAAHLKDANQDGAVVIIDEAHLLVSDELGPNERLQKFHLDRIRGGILKSWKKKKGLPVRVLLLSGTPVADPVYFFKLMNFVRDPEQHPHTFPETLQDIQKRYNKDNVFDFGLLQSDMDGYISYLDTKMDISRFAQRTKSIVNPSYMSMRDPSSEDLQVQDLTKTVASMELKMKSTIKNYLKELKTTRKHNFVDELLEGIEKYGSGYFDNKQKLQEMVKKRATRKMSRDASQESSFAHCKVLQPRKEDVELLEAYKANL